jgi:N-dimethylarginine dimethylaminohydrolase
LRNFKLNFNLINFTYKNQSKNHHPKTHFQALVEVLYCIYHGENSPTFDQTALDFMFAADFFEMIPLRDHAAQYLAQNLEKENVFKVIHAALQLSLNKLAKEACEFVKLNVSEEESVSF